MSRARGGSRQLPAGSLAAPYVAGLVVLLLVPTAAAAVLAVTEYYGFEPPRFTGLDNVRRAVSDELFLTSLRNVALVAVVAVPLRVLLAVGAALVLATRFRGAAAGRVATYLPSVVPDAAWALLWLWLLNPLYGPLPAVLRSVGVGAPGFLTDPTAARVGIALMFALQVGESFVVALAARRAIPERLYEAAAVESARPSYVLRRLTLPLMAPLLALLAVRDTAVTLQVSFTPSYLLTDGGPDRATLFLPLYGYDVSFEQLQYGYGAAITLSMAALTLVLSLLGFALIRRLARIR